MTRRSLIAGVLLAGLVLLIWKGLLAPGEPSSPPLPRLWQAPEFSLIDSAGQAFDSEELSGRVWVVDFFFTRCPGPCPLMTRKLLAVSQRLPAPSEVRFVSISIDPDYDRPLVLEAYARHWGIDLKRWHLLTGDRADTTRLTVEGFKTALQTGQAGPDGQGPNPREIIHGTHFLLVDRQGWVRGVFDANDRDTEERLLGEIQRLLTEPAKSVKETF